MLAAVLSPIEDHRIMGSQKRSCSSLKTPLGQNAQLCDCLGKASLASRPCSTRNKSEPVPEVQQQSEHCDEHAI